MIEIFRRRYLLSIREVYFSNGSAPSTIARDIDVYIQSTASPLPNYSLFSTLLIDLSTAPDSLFSSLSKACRYEIRRSCEKDPIHCTVDFSPNPDVLKQFTDFYNQFASFRGVGIANTDKLRAFASRNALIISQARDSTSNMTYSMHCYITDGVRARLYHSATLPRESSGNKSNVDPQLVGRSNRQLHWKSMLSMKESGLLVYDFGGISNTTALKGIDDFKRQFGGTEVVEYNSMIPISTAGRVALFMLGCFKKATP